MKTLDLLDRATEGEESARSLAKQLGFTSNALNAARNRGHLSPELAGALADHLGLDPGPWIALAAIESAKKPLPARIRERVTGAVGKTLATLAAVGAGVTLFFGGTGGVQHAQAHGATTDNVYSGNRRAKARLIGVL